MKFVDFMTESIRKQAEEITAALLDDIRESNREESILLVKAPGNEDAEALMCSITFKCSAAAMPVYISQIIEAAAMSCGVSYEEMSTHVNTIHKIMDRITEHKTQNMPQDAQTDETDQ